MPAKWRGVACPKTYITRTKANGDLECWKFPPECSAKVGNPVNLLDGCKLQREVDYRSRTPGGLEVERFYNSGGYFRFDVAPERVDATSGARRGTGASFRPPVAGAVLAYAQRADGAILVFPPSGREMHNSQGGGSALLQRLADAAGATTGWRLTTAGSDVETYDASGRLLAVTLRAGWTYTLAYGGERKALDGHRHLRQQAHVYLRCDRDAAADSSRPETASMSTATTPGAGSCP